MSEPSFCYYVIKIHHLTVGYEDAIKDAAAVKALYRNMEDEQRMENEKEKKERKKSKLSDTFPNLNNFLLQNG